MAPVELKEGEQLFAVLRGEVNEIAGIADLDVGWAVSRRIGWPTVVGSWTPALRDRGPGLAAAPLKPVKCNYAQVNVAMISEENRQFFWVWETAEISCHLTS